MTGKILIVEDQPDIANLIALHIRDLSIEVDKAADGQSGLEMALRGDYRLVILDLMLPRMDGIEVCRKLRSREQYVPILMLTSKSSELDRVLGLEMGADDYVTKPFSIKELIARVKAILRRVQAGEDKTAAADRDGGGSRISFGTLNIDLDKRRVTIGASSVELTVKEFELLSHFARHPGRVFTRTQLLDSVWGYGHDGYEHTVNSHINRLRAKIENDPAKPDFILTVWGVGYKFNDHVPG